jgi:sugar/nucleoside kinase (ribokinase family)
MQRVGVLGTLVRDRIWHPSRGGGAGPIEQWGGIAYSLAAARAACPRGWSVHPLLKVGTDLHPEALVLLDRLGLPANGVEEVAEATNRVDLHYLDAENREEHLRGGVPGWRWEELGPRLRGLDALYVNFISGFELDLATAERLRVGFAGPIYADLHSLFLGPRVDGARVPRSLPERSRWLRCFDAVQVNAAELRLLAREADPREYGLAAVARGLPLLAVTLGADGAACAVGGGARLPPLLAGAAAPAAHAGWRRLPLRDGDAGGDPTGCGDIWGSVFFLSLLAGATLESAGRRANAAAGARLRVDALAALPERIREALAGSPVEGR